jgi:hypothetical protein
MSAVDICVTACAGNERPDCRRFRKTKTSLNDGLRTLVGGLCTFCHPLVFHSLFVPLPPLNITTFFLCFRNDISMQCFVQIWLLVFHPILFAFDIFTASRTHKTQTEIRHGNTEAAIFCSICIDTFHECNIVGVRNEN